MKVDEILTAKEKPLFLYYSMQNVHYPLQAPEHERLKYKWIKDRHRRDYAAMLAATDKGPGLKISALRKKNI